MLCQSLGSSLLLEVPPDALVKGLCLYYADTTQGRYDSPLDLHAVQVSAGDGFTSHAHIHDQSKLSG
jgi:hypothetical protein